MALLKLMRSGAFVEIRPPQKYRLQKTKMFTEQEFHTVSEYVAGKIEHVQRFSCATLFGGSWPEPLSLIWERFDQDETEASFFLGWLVIDTLVSDEALWGCSDFDLQNRGFETNYYWRRNVKDQYAGAAT